MHGTQLAKVIIELKLIIWPGFRYNLRLLWFLQAAAQLLSASMVIYAHTVPRSAASSSILLQPWFVTLIFAGAIERLSGIALGVAMERDWVVLVCFSFNHLYLVIQKISLKLAFFIHVQLAGINRPIALAEANAVLSRIDLLCEVNGSSELNFLFQIHVILIICLF